MLICFCWVAAAESATAAAGITAGERRSCLLFIRCLRFVFSMVSLRACKPTSWRRCSLKTGSLLADPETQNIRTGHCGYKLLAVDHESHGRSFHVHVRRKIPLRLAFALDRRRECAIRLPI